MHADQDGVIPGNALVVDPKKQFRPLSKFGNAFLNRFQCSNTKSDVLKGKSVRNKVYKVHSEVRVLKSGFKVCEEMNIITDENSEMKILLLRIFQNCVYFAILSFL